MNIEQLRNTLKECYSNNFEYEIVEDEILDINCFSTLSNKMNEQQYNDLQKKINEYLIDKSAYQLYFWSDGSGYGYWKEDYNYMMLTLYIKDFNNIDLEVLYADIDTILNKFEEYLN